MQNQTKVSQWGNSLAIRIPQDLAAKLAIERGINVELQIEVIAKPPNLPGTRAPDPHFSATATLVCDVSRGFAITSIELAGCATMPAETQKVPSQ